MLQFYDIDTKYAAYLQSYDSQVPNISYGTNNKFVCGIVLSINGCNYFAPISSQTRKQKTNMLIQDTNGRVISSIKFCFMIPVPSCAIVPKDFSKIRMNDPNYANLLQAEYQFCNRHEADILAKAQKIYQIGCNPNHALNYTCCKFTLLEEKCKQYNPA